MLIHEEVGPRAIEACAQEYRRACLVRPAIDIERVSQGKDWSDPILLRGTNDFLMPVGGLRVPTIEKTIPTTFCPA